MVKRFSARLRAQRYGLFLGFRSGFGWAQWWRARPTIVYRIIYPMMVAVSVACIIFVAVGGQDEHSDRGHVSDEHSGSHHDRD